MLLCPIFGCKPMGVVTGLGFPPFPLLGSLSPPLFFFLSCGAGRAGGSPSRDALPPSLAKRRRRRVLPLASLALRSLLLPSSSLCSPRPVSPPSRCLVFSLFLSRLLFLLVSSSLSFCLSVFLSVLSFSVLSFSFFFPICLLILPCASLMSLGSCFCVCSRSFCRFGFLYFCFLPFVCCHVVTFVFCSSFCPCLFGSGFGVARVAVLPCLLLPVLLSCPPSSLSLSLFLSFALPQHLIANKREAFRENA